MHKLKCEADFLFAARRKVGQTLSHCSVQDSHMVLFSILYFHICTCLENFFLAAKSKNKISCVLQI